MGEMSSRAPPAPSEQEKLVFRQQSALEGLVEAIYNADRTVIGGNHTSEDQLGLIYQRVLEANLALIETRTLFCEATKPNDA